MSTLWLLALCALMTWNLVSLIEEKDRRGRWALAAVAVYGIYTLASALR